jgi:hypothetical protein
MSDDAVRLFESVYGGPPAWSELQLNIPFSEAREAEEFFNELGSLAAAQLGVGRIVVRFSGSVDIGVRLHPYGASQYLIVIPIGLFARLYAFDRRLWPYLDLQSKGINEKMVLRFANSPADDWDADRFIVPPRLHSILGEYVEKQDFWFDLNTFDSENVHSQLIDHNVSILVAQALLLLFAHEMGHIEHSTFATAVRDTAASLGTARAKAVNRILAKGLELDTDYFAGEQLAGVWRVSSQTNGYFDQEEASSADFFRIGFGLVLLLGIFDPRMRALRAYDSVSYPHPIVRHHALRHGFRHWLETNCHDRVSLWDRASLVGWFKAEQCLGWFTLRECMDGASADSLVPIHSLVYGGEASAPYVSTAIQRGQALFELIRKLRDRHRNGGLTALDLEELLTFDDRLREDARSGE